MTWTEQPEKAWVEHIKPATSSQTWIEDSSDISEDIKLSKRELFALILLAHIKNVTGENWIVGYDSTDSEPNDGFITDGDSKYLVEHKVVPQMTNEEVLSAILSTYEKYAKNGDGYGNGRTLVIHANKEARGLVKVSSLRDAIGDNCPFDNVLLLSCVTQKNGGRIAVMHITKHYPAIKKSDQPGPGISQVDFDVFTGEADVPHVGFELD